MDGLLGPGHVPILLVPVNLVCEGRFQRAKANAQLSGVDSRSRLRVGLDAGDLNQAFSPLQKLNNLR